MLMMYQFVNNNDPNITNYLPSSAPPQPTMTSSAISANATTSNYPAHRCTKRRRSSYTIEFKVHVVEAFRHSNQQNVSKIATEFGIDRKRVREWNYTYDKLKKMSGDLQKRRRKVEFSRQVRSREIEEGVLNYYYQQRSAGQRVKNKDLQQIALYIAHKTGIPDFKASNMWLYRWKKRHHLLNKPPSATAALVRGYQSTDLPILISV
ncbi:Tigger transposable element derived 5 [Trichoplax sp. H2]|nr:Tigger transposable element derived 5 [Trichoplax sp. H2]|eukprot:RDD36995.1 Tigger transposable element derived 5 [Trichoplax sp. H2]